METIQQHRTAFIVEGILFILLGILAIALPGVMTLGVELFVGWLFLIGGIVQGYRTLTSSNAAPGYWMSLLSGILSIIVGGMFLLYPLQGIAALTMLLIAFFLIEGSIKIAFGVQLKPLQGWGWLVLSGIISLLMAGILWSGWPGTAIWAIGLLVGINMIFFGSSLLTLALSISKKPIE